MRKITRKEWWGEGRGWVRCLRVFYWWSWSVGLIVCLLLVKDVNWWIFAGIFVAYLVLLTLLVVSKKDELERCESCGEIIVTIHCRNCGWVCPKCGKRVEY